MRFLKARESVKDPRRVYLLIIALLASLTIMAAVSERLTERLYDLEDGKRIDMLFECADALQRLDAAADEIDDTNRLEALWKFQNAAVGLEFPTQLTKNLLEYAESLYNGESVIDPRIIETELLRAAESRDAAKLERILLPPETTYADESANISEPPISERYLINEARRQASVLLHDVKGLPRLWVTDDGYDMTAENLYVFFGRDAELREMFFLRSGEADGEMSDGNIVFRASELAKELGCQADEGVFIEEKCGYSLIAIRDELKMIFDRAGRLCTARRVFID